MVSEAYTSRYKGILGRNSFKHAVQKYHKRTKVELSEKVQRISTSTGMRFELHDTFQREETDIVEVESEPLGVTADTDVAVASTSKPDSHVQHAQRSLERLPQKILIETRSIQQYMQLMGDLDREGHSTGGTKFVDETLWDLVDVVMGGRKLAECTKMDILKDGEARQVRGLALFFFFSGCGADMPLMARRPS